MVIETPRKASDPGGRMRPGIAAVDTQQYTTGIFLRLQNCRFVLN
ncbi:MAG: hypothetical protein ACOX8B_07215 [Lachnospiraceae bacterium]